MVKIKCKDQNEKNAKYRDQKCIYIKTLTFSSLKTYFIYFNNTLYNTFNIKTSILTDTTLK